MAISKINHIQYYGFKNITYFVFDFLKMPESVLKMAKNYLFSLHSISLYDESTFTGGYFPLLLLWLSATEDKSWRLGDIFRVNNDNIQVL